MANFGTIKTRVLRKYKGSTSVSFTAEVANAINDAIEYYASEPVWFREEDATLTLVANNADLTANAGWPSDFWYLRGDAAINIIQSNSSYPLDKISASAYDLMNKQTLGRPQYYRELSGKVQVYPYPDTTYTCQIRYIKKYADLVNDSDSNDWTIYAPALIEARALSDLFLSEGHDKEMSDYWRIQEIDALESLRLTSKMRVASGILSLECPYA